MPYDNQAAKATPLLFTKLRLRGVTARNRLVLSPMVQYRARDGMPNDFHLVHLGRFAQGRMGIVFTEFDRGGTAWARHAPRLRHLER